MTEPVLLLDKVKFRYPNKENVLSGVDLRIDKGQVVCVIGRSGCGKSTLLKLIGGLLIGRGQILINNEDSSKIPPPKRNLGYVFQNESALFPHLSVRENVAFPFKHGGRKLPGDDYHTVVNKMLSLTGLLAHANKRPHQLSGGQLQRIAVARSVVYEPSLLLLDEPLRSLDNVTKQEILDLLIQINGEKGTTMLYVTHDDREVKQIATHVAVLYDGKIARFGKIEDVLEEPRENIVRELLCIP